MKPYKKLKSENLGLLLFTARATAIIGFIFVILAILFAFVGVGLSSAVGYTIIAGTMSLVPMAIGVLFMSGLMAAVVAFEENYRVRTEHMVKGSDL